MKRSVAAVALVAVAVVGAGILTGPGAVAGTRAAHAARAAASGGTWGTAGEVPGTAALNQGGTARVTSLSCPRAGSCGAGGFYFDMSGNSQAFVVSSADGTWGTAVEAPGTAALNQGAGGASVSSVSCASAGRCSAGGYYTDDSGNQQVFVASQADGAWHRTIEVPGTAALNQDGHAVINSVSCGSAGNCSAGGSYIDSSGVQPFVVSETSGTWDSAMPVPGMTALNQRGTYAATQSLSCASAGNCSAGGVYTDLSGNQQVFVVSQTNGTWGTAEEVPGTASLNTGGLAVINSVSCSSVDHCSAGGYYTESIGGRFGNEQAFVVDQS